MLSELLTRFQPNSLLPALPLAGAFVIGGLVYAALVGWACGVLKLRRGIRTNFTRKIFHVLIFSAALKIHTLGGFAAVNAFAIGVTTVVLCGIWWGTGNIIFEGMARERDEPHRAFYVFIPLLTTALGGVVANLLTEDYAVVGYLVVGWGDAVGEPVGVWFGKHEYPVLTLRSVPCTRTLEGSMAVGITAWFAAIVGLTMGLDIPVATAAVHGIIVALVSAVLEAVSPHGSDNFTVMVGAAATAWLLG